MSESFRKLFIALLAQFPLLGGLWAKWSVVQQRPLLSASLGVGTRGSNGSPMGTYTRGGT